MIRLFVILIAVVFSLKTFAQDVVPTKGKEFWFGFMFNPDANVITSDNLLYVYISSNKNTNGNITIPGGTYNENFTVTANVTKEIIIDKPIGHAVLSEQIEKKGFVLTTEDTVSVFVVNFESASADGTKVLPIRSIGNQYRLLGYESRFEGLSSEFLIVATADNTEVEIIPAANTIGGRPAGVPFYTVLNRGDVYQVRSLDDLTGSEVRTTDQSGSCKPFAFFGGAECANIPADPFCTFCDHIVDQQFPTSAWGREYHMAPILGTTSYTYRVMADRDNTSLTINGGTPIILNEGEFIERNDVSTPQVFNADKSILVVQYLEGNSCAGAGDPSMMSLNATEQRINNITFTTIKSVRITQHAINVITPTDHISELLLDNAAVNPASFVPFPADPSFSYARITINEGSHTLMSPQGFIAYIYGVGADESYAYSAGSFSPITKLGDTIYCTEDSVTLTNILNFEDPYWTTADDPNDTLATGDVFKVLPEGGKTYLVHGLEIPSLCPKEYFYVVESPAPPAISFIKDDDTLCASQPVEISVVTNPSSSLYRYQWSPSSLVNNPSSSTVLVSPPESMWFYCRVYTATLCTDVVDSIFVEVKPSEIVSLQPVSNDSFICRGDTITLKANSQTQLFYDNFNSGISGNWLTVDGGEASVACSSTTGEGLWFNGNGVRQAVTPDLNVSGGGTITFDLKIANGTFPCDNADFGEDVVLEYSLNGGGNWFVIETFFEILYPNFTRLEIAIPEVAHTANSRFRWRQLSNSGLNQDNWMIDEVLITSVDSIGFTYQWTPDDSVFSDLTYTTQASPKKDIKYYVTAESAENCEYLDSILIEVGDPFDLNTTNDTLMCYLNGLPIYAMPTAGEGHTIAWMPDSGLSDPLSFTPIASPNKTTSYIAEVTSRHGCFAQDTVTITYVRQAELLIFPPSDTICIGDTLNLLGQIYNSHDCYTDTVLTPIDIDTSLIVEPDIIHTNNSIFNALNTNTGRIQYKINTINEGFGGAPTIEGPLTDVGIVADELIMGIGVFIDSTGADSTFENFTIRMRCGDLGEPLPVGFGAYIFFNDLTTVYTPKTVSLNTGWNYFSFDTSYFLQGSLSNIYVDICYQNSDSNSYASIRVEDSPGQGQGMVSGMNACDTAEGGIYNFIPATQIVHSPVVEPNMVFSWTPVGEVDDPDHYEVITSPDTTVIYELSAKDTISGCVFKQNSRVQVDDSVINVSVIPNDTFICEGGIMQLTASGGNFYEWTPAISLNNPNIPTPIASPNDSTTYSVTISNACWTTMREATIDVEPSPMLEKPDNIELCSGDTIQVALTSDDGIIKWTPSYGLDSPNIQNPLIYTDQTLTYNILVTDSFTKCFSSTSLTVDVYSDNNGVILTGDTSICKGDTVTLRGANAIDYEWLPANLILGNNDIPQVSSISDTSVRYNLVFAYQYCGNDTQSVLVTVDSPSFEVFQDSVICIGDNVLLYVEGDTNNSYNWSPLEDLTILSNDSALVEPSTTRTYYVTGENTLGCNKTDSVLIRVVSLAGLDALEDTSIALGSSIVLSDYPSDLIYAWTPSDYLDCADCPRPTSTPDDNILYTVVITDSLNVCMARDSMMITVVNPYLDIPSAFSPNDDDKNDVFMPIQEGVKEIQIFEIYNRWGQLVFSTSQVNTGWDGTHNGEIQPIGIYTYVFKATLFGENDTDIERNGVVTLLK